MHQVAWLGSGHEAMNARKQLEEALKDVPDVINGFWYPADVFKALGFNDALITAMKGTTKNRGVNALIQGHLVSTTYRSKIAPSVRYFSLPANILLDRCIVFEHPTELGVYVFVNQDMPQTRRAA